jgi:hypothetical protein
MEAGSAARMAAALRVLTTYCGLGTTATPEDEESVRWWAGDDALSLADAATVVIQRELERGFAQLRLSGRASVWHGSVE